MHKSTGSWGAVVFSFLKSINSFSRIRRGSPRYTAPGRHCLRKALITAGVTLASPLALSAPTADGLFYSTGDEAEYSFLQGDSSGDGLGSVYIAVDGQTVYVALVAHETATDTVCGGSNAYISSVDWGNGRNGGGGGCFQATQSEYGRFGIECGANANTPDWDFNQSLAYPVDTQGNEIDPKNMAGPDQPGTAWVSDPFGGAGQVFTGVPPGYTSGSSTAWNFQNSNTVAGGWDMAPGDGGITTWKSPDVDGDDDLINPLGQPHNDQYRIDLFGERGPQGEVIGTGYLQNGSGQTYWEWPLLYEFSFDASSCTGPMSISPGESHNSPQKDGGTEIDFEENVPILDFGDAPDSYGTSRADGGNSAAHLILLGDGNVLRMGDRIDSEGDGQPNDDATGDGTDEDGISLPDADVSGQYTATVTVNHGIAGETANLCGWVDFDQNGTFEADEAACVSVTASVDGNGDPVAQQVDLVFEVPLEDRNNSGDFFTRFRLTTDSIDETTPTGILGDLSANAANGEVEDHMVNITSLPVTLHRFESRLAGRNVRFEWGTVSETSTAGFNLWGQVNGEWQQLNEELLFNSGSDSVAPQSYHRTVRAPDDGELESLGLSSVDTDGTENFFGPFEPGKRYGSDVAPDPIPWQEIQAELDSRMQGKGYQKRGRSWRKPAKGEVSNAASVDLSVVNLETRQVGMHRIAYSDLLDAGVDFAGVSPQGIALTHKGEPVARHVDTGAGKTFGPGGFIDFHADAVDSEDARYTDTNIYQLQINPALASESGYMEQKGTTGNAPAYYLETVKRDVNKSYDLGMAGDNPWYEHRLAGIPSGRTDTAEVQLGLDQLVESVNDPGTAIHLGLAGGTTFGGTEPDHLLRVYLNGAEGLLGETRNDGRVYWNAELPVSPGILQDGLNAIRVEVPGVEGIPFDIILVDTYAITYPREFVAVDDVLSFTARGEAFEIRGLSGNKAVAYASDGNDLIRLASRPAGREGGRFKVRIPGIPGTDAAYWVSTESALLSPTVISAGAPADLLNPAADYVIVTHANFIDKLRGADDFIAAKQAQGYNVKVVDVAEIYQQYGYGFPVPGAIRAYLQAQDEIGHIEHVLLVGGATSDPLDYTENGSIDFVPTAFTQTGRHMHQTPSDGLLVDLYGEAGPASDPDGVPDKSVGRWPVRTGAELDTIIAKTLQYQQTMTSRQSALLVADATDSRFEPFSEQTERVAASLTHDGAPWTELTRVFMDDYGSLADAQSALKQGFADGNAVTLFSGHGALSSWTFPGLLDWKVARTLTNTEEPTLVGTMSCYTSYFVSPSTDTIGHQLLLSGKHGAALIQGAATLSGFNQNETMLKGSMSAMSGGDTAGRSVLRTRRALGPNYGAVISNWSLLGDPSLSLSPPD